MFVLKKKSSIFSACKGKHFHKTTKQKERKNSKNIEKSYFFTLLWNKTAKIYRFSMIFDINQLQGAMTA